MNKLFQLRGNVIEGFLIKGDEKFCGSIIKSKGGKVKENLITVIFILTLDKQHAEIRF